MAIFKKTEKEAEKTAAATTATGTMPMILFGPRLTEKSTNLAEKGKYVFNVARSANKVEIKKAVEKAYKVNVVKVNISNTQGKAKTSGRIAGRTSNFRKAIVTLRSGQKLEGATETI